MNKWDLALHAAREKAESDKKSTRKNFNANKLIADYEVIVRNKLKFLSYAPVVFLSAVTGQHIERLYSLIDRVAEARQRRVTTGELNRWISKVDLDRGTTPASRRMKIYYMTQATAAPPTFVLFTNQTKPLHFSFQRFLENQLREEFDFIGTPIRFTLRLKKHESSKRERAIKVKERRRGPSGDRMRHK
jgi:GTPase